jgi:hypothetical protein
MTPEERRFLRAMAMDYRVFGGNTADAARALLAAPPAEEPGRCAQRYIRGECPQCDCGDGPAPAPKPEPRVESRRVEDALNEVSSVAIGLWGTGKKWIDIGGVIDAAGRAQEAYREEKVTSESHASTCASIALKRSREVSELRARIGKAAKRLRYDASDYALEILAILSGEKEPK